MPRIVPHQILFDRAKRFNKISNFFVWMSASISILILLVEHYYPLEKTSLKVLSATNCTGIFFVYLFDILFNHFFFLAGKAKRLDFIDNSFGTDFSGGKSQGYFSNDNLPIGIYKMTVNCFENSLFSSQISSKIRWERKYYSAIPNFITYFNNTAINKIVQFTTRIINVYQNFLGLFNDIKQLKNFEIKQPEMLKIILEYQTTISWGGILLDNKLFEKYNANLSEDWERLKSIYNIEKLNPTAH